VQARLAGLGVAVYGGQVYPQTVLPSLVVQTPEEVVQEDAHTMGWPDRTTRTLPLEIACRAQATADLDDVLDTLAADVEAAMAGDVRLGGLCKSIVYSGATLELSAEVEPPVGLLRMAYEVQYRVSASAPDTPAA
jgi:hypothetical protein